MSGEGEPDDYDSHNETYTDPAKWEQFRQEQQRQHEERMQQIDKEAEELIKKQKEAHEKRMREIERLYVFKRKMNTAAILLYTDLVDSKYCSGFKDFNEKNKKQCIILIIDRIRRRIRSEPEYINNLQQQLIPQYMLDHLKSIYQDDIELMDDINIIEESSPIVRQAIAEYRREIETGIPFSMKTSLYEKYLKYKKKYLNLKKK